MDKDSKILIVGHNDIIENSLLFYFKKNGFKDVYASSTSGLDVLEQAAVRKFFEKTKPEYVFLSSVCSGGIAANQKFAAEFIYNNLEAQNNIIHAAYKSGARKLLFFTGSCAYPKEALQPIREESLLTGPLEETSEPYSVAKIAGVKLCQAYKKQYGFNAVVTVPATVYGPGSDTRIETAHVIGALIGKFYQAVASGQSEVVVWGSGKPRREFLFVDDFVDASIFLMDRYEGREMVNMGCGSDISIAELAEMIKAVSGYKGKIIFDADKPDGTMRKLMDNSRIKGLGWQAKTTLKDGIARTYQWYSEIQTAQKRS